MQTVATQTQQSLPTLPGEQGLILDETGWEKAGIKSVGVARQYIGNIGKICNAQVGVFAALVKGQYVGLVNARLFLPQEWAQNSGRCKAAGVPADQQAYQTKAELAVSMLRNLPPIVTYSWVGGDSIYGNSPTLRNHLIAQKQAFVLDVGEELGVYLSDPVPSAPVWDGGKGRRPTRLVSEQQPVLLKNLLAAQVDLAWQTLTYRAGTQGRLSRQALSIPVWLWKAGIADSAQALDLLISRQVDGSDLKYSLVYAPSGEVSLATSLHRQMQRYWIERAFQDIKQELGLHQSQTRSWVGWYHHVALTMMALHFMLHTRIEEADDLPLLSCSDIKLMLAKSLLNKLHQADTLWQAIEQRHRLRSQNAHLYIYQT
jgi:SRSO17 transposase